MKDFEFFEGFLLQHYTTRTTAVLGRHSSVSRRVSLNALSSWALGQTVNGTSSFLLAGIVTSKLVKSPLLVFHATLAARLESIQLRKAGETDSRLRDTLCGGAARSSQQPAPWVPRHREKLWCQQMSPACTKKKKTPTRKCPRENVWLAPWRFHIMKS